MADRMCKMSSYRSNNTSKQRIELNSQLIMGQKRARHVLSTDHFGLSDAGETAKEMDELHLQFDILCNRAAIRTVRLSTAMCVFRSVGHIESTTSQLFTFFEGIAQVIAMNIDDDLLCNIMLLTTLNLLAKSYNSDHNIFVIDSSFNGLVTVLTDYYSRDDGDAGTVTVQPQQSRLKRKFAQQTRKFDSPDIVSNVTASSLWKEIGGENLITNCPQNQVLCGFVLGRCLHCMLQYLNEVSSRAMQQSNNQEDDSEVLTSKQLLGKESLPVLNKAKRAMEHCQERFRVSINSTCALDVMLSHLTLKISEYIDKTKEIFFLLGLLQCVCIHMPSNQKFVAQHQSAAPTLLIKILRLSQLEVFETLSGIKSTQLPPELLVAHPTCSLMILCEDLCSGVATEFHHVEIFLEVLRTLITLCSDCHHACDLILEDLGTLPWLVGLLLHCISVLMTTEKVESSYYYVSCTIGSFFCV
jgi:hypothetical protein